MYKFDRVIYDDKCTVHCTDKDQNLDAVIMSFKPEEYMNIVLGQELRVNLQYNEKHRIYVGSKHGLEFTTDGPKRLG